MDDLKLDKNYKRGSSGPKVKLIQEWLCLRGHNVLIDGDFGPATERAVRRFQQANGLTVDGVVGPQTFGVLVKPMTDALNPIPPGNRTLGQMVVAYAEQHLAQHPREVGGENRGPWVRLYMKGSEGKGAPWCAGFACFMLESACKSLSVPQPIPSSVSSSQLAAEAKQRGIFRKGSTLTDKSAITPGSFFLVTGGPTGWKHTGIVHEAESEVLNTIEGNTNDEGSSEGYEVCRRTRGYPGIDFIII